MDRFARAGRLLPITLLLASSPGAGGSESRSTNGLCDLNDLREESASSQEPILIECDCELPQELRALEGADPGADAARATRRGDLRYVGIMEFMLLVPGIEDPAEIRRNGVRIVPGTSDYIRCYEQERLTEVAVGIARDGVGRAPSVSFDRRSEADFG